MRNCSRLFETLKKEKDLADIGASHISKHSRRLQREESDRTGFGTYGLPIEQLVEITAIATTQLCQKKKIPPRTLFGSSTDAEKFHETSTLFACACVDQLIRYDAGIPTLANPKLCFELLTSCAGSLEEAYRGKLNEKSLKAILQDNTITFRGARSVKDLRGLLRYDRVADKLSSTSDLTDGSLSLLTDAPALGKGGGSGGGGTTAGSAPLDAGTARGSIATNETPDGKNTVWQWYDGDRWILFDTASSRTLETARQEGRKNVRIDVKGKGYEVGVLGDRMHQKNLKTGFKRRVRRIQSHEEGSLRTKTSDISSKTSKSTQQPVVVWEWMDRDKKWSPYDAKVCKKFEESLRMGRRSIPFSLRGGKISFIDRPTHTVWLVDKVYYQINDHSHVRHPVRRCLAAAIVSPSSLSTTTNAPSSSPATRASFTPKSRKGPLASWCSLCALHKDRHLESGRCVFAKH
eukprot:g2710.t1